MSLQQLSIVWVSFEVVAVHAELSILAFTWADDEVLTQVQTFTRFFPASRRRAVLWTNLQVSAYCDSRFVQGEMLMVTGEEIRQSLSIVQAKFSTAGSVLWKIPQLLNRGSSAQFTECQKEGFESVATWRPQPGKLSIYEWAFWSSRGHYIDSLLCTWTLDIIGCPPPYGLSFF